jgi:hypothetical protein
VTRKLDPPGIYNRGEDIDRASWAMIEKMVRLVEIIPGKGSGRLEKRCPSLP